MPLWLYALDDKSGETIIRVDALGKTVPNGASGLTILFSLKIIAAIEEPAVIERILTHLGLSAQPPPRTPARRGALFQAA